MNAVLWTHSKIAAVTSFILGIILLLMSILAATVFVSHPGIQPENHPVIDAVIIFLLAAASLYCGIIGCLVLKKNKGFGFYNAIFVIAVGVLFCISIPGSFADNKTEPESLIVGLVLFLVCAASLSFNGIILTITNRQHKRKPTHKNGEVYGIIGIIAAFVCILYVPILFGLLAVILGIVAVRRKSKVMGTIAITLGIVFMLIGILFGYAVGVLKDQGLFPNQKLAANHNILQPAKSSIRYLQQDEYTDGYFYFIKPRGLSMNVSLDSGYTAFILKTTEGKTVLLTGFSYDTHDPYETSFNSTMKSILDDVDDTGVTHTLSYVQKNITPSGYVAYSQNIILPYLAPDMLHIMVIYDNKSNNAALIWYDLSYDTDAKNNACINQVIDSVIFPNTPRKINSSSQKSLCVQCDVDKDCQQQYYTFDTGYKLPLDYCISNKCVYCRNDSDCHNQEQPYCDVNGDHTCLACVDDSTCNTTSNCERFGFCHCRKEDSYYARCAQ